MTEGAGVAEPAPLAEGGPRPEVDRGQLVAHAKITGTRARVAVEVSIAWPTPLAPVCLQVRDRVGEQVRQLAGLRVDGVDVTVVPVLGDELPESERLA